MAESWGVSPLGNLSDFPVPKFETGTGLAAIMEQKRLRALQAQEFGADIGAGLAKTMEQRKKDEMYNVLMDNYSKEFGIENPFAGGGEKGYKAASELIKLRMLAQKQDLAERMGEARISRLGRASTGGGGGGGGGGGTVTPTGDPNVWEDPVSHKRFLKGPRGGFTPLGGPAGEKAAPSAKPRTQHQQDELYLDVESLRAEAEKQKAENIKKQLPNVPFTRQHELNPRAKLLGVDPVTGEPLAAPTPTPAPVATGAPGPSGAETGIAPSREEAAPNQLYRAPDGSLRRKTA